MSSVRCHYLCQCQVHGCLQVDCSVDRTLNILAVCNIILYYPAFLLSFAISAIMIALLANDGIHYYYIIYIVSGLILTVTGITTECPFADEKKWSFLLVESLSG